MNVALWERSFSINLLAFYHECRSLIGCATHYLFKQQSVSVKILAAGSCLRGNLIFFVIITNHKKCSPGPYWIIAAGAYPRVLQHEAARSIRRPFPRNQVIQVSYFFILLGGERHCESQVSCPRTERIVPGWGSNPDRSLRGRAH